MFGRGEPSGGLPLGDRERVGQLRIVHESLCKRHRGDAPLHSASIGLKIALGRSSPKEQHVTLNVEFKGFTPGQSLRDLIQHLTKALSKRMRRFSRDAVALRLVLSETPAHRLCRVSITLDLPGKTIPSSAEGHDREAALREAFADVERQLETYKGVVRGQHWRKRLHPHHAVPESKPFFETVEPYIDNLTSYCRHILAHAESRGDVIPDNFTCEDLLDATLLEGASEFARRPPGSLRAWLLRLATRQLDHEIKRSFDDRRRTVHVEDDVPEISPMEWVSTLG